MFPESSWMSSIYTSFATLTTSDTSNAEIVNNKRMLELSNWLREITLNPMIMLQSKSRMLILKFLLFDKYHIARRN